MDIRKYENGGVDIILSHKDKAEMGERMVEENKEIVDVRKYKGGCGVDMILSHKDKAEMG